MHTEKIPLLRKSPSLILYTDSSHTQWSKLNTEHVLRKILEYLPNDDDINYHGGTTTTRRKLNEKIMLLHVCQSWRNRLLHEYGSHSKQCGWIPEYERMYDKLLSVDEKLYELHYDIQVENNFYRRNFSGSDEGVLNMMQSSQQSVEDDSDVYHIDQFYRKHKRREDGINYFDEYLRICRRHYMFTRERDEIQTKDFYWSVASQWILLISIVLLYTLTMSVLTLFVLSFGFNVIHYPTVAVSALIMIIAVLFSVGIGSMFVAERTRKDGILCKSKTWLSNGYDGTVLFWTDIFCTLAISICIFLFGIVSHIQLESFKLSWSILLMSVYPIGLLAVPPVFTATMIVCHKFFSDQTMTTVLQEKIRVYSIWISSTIGASWLPIIIALIVPGLYLNKPIDQVWRFIMISVHFSGLLLAVSFLCLFIRSRHSVFKYWIGLPLLLQSLLVFCCVISVDAAWKVMGTRILVIFMIPITSIMLQSLLSLIKMYSMLKRRTR